MKRDMEKAREWKQRSKPLTRTELPKQNRKRRQKRNAETFGVQAALCRGLPCCACWPHLYGEDLLALEHYTHVRRCDPHHSPTVAAGGKDKDTVPLCRWHHERLDSPGHSEQSVQKEVGIDFREVAARIHADIGGNR